MLSCLLRFLFYKKTLQTYKGIINVVIVDDYSENSSSEKLQNLIQNYKENLNINYIKHKFNKRLSEARNTAINTFKADFIQLLDSDDTLHPECLRYKLESFHKDNYPLTTSSIFKNKIINQKNDFNTVYKDPKE